MGQSKDSSRRVYATPDFVHDRDFRLRKIAMASFGTEKPKRFSIECLGEIIALHSGYRWVSGKVGVVRWLIATYHLTFEDALRIVGDGDPNKSLRTESELTTYLDHPEIHHWLAQVTPLIEEERAKLAHEAAQLDDSSLSLFN